MRKWWLLLAALALWLAVRLRDARGAGPVDAGRTGRHVLQPARIVSMAPNLTEILFALGLGERVVGVTQDSDYPPAALSKPRVGTFWQPNIEAIIAAKPDLVVTLAFEQQSELARRLEADRLRLPDGRHRNDRRSVPRHRYRRRRCRGTPNRHRSWPGVSRRG